jgi:hypothetical protein
MVMMTTKMICVVDSFTEEVVLASSLRELMLFTVSKIVPFFPLSAHKPSSVALMELCRVN